MHIGVVFGYDENLKMGSALLIDSKLKILEFNKRLCQFSLQDSKTIIHKWKIIMIDQIEKIENGFQFEFNFMDRHKCSYQAGLIHDNYPTFKKEDFIEIKKNSYEGELLLDYFPFANHKLFDFFIQNEFYLENGYNHFIKSRVGEEIKKITNLNSILKKIDSFSIQKAIDSFEVRIGESTNSRPGKEDSARISISASINYWNYQDLGTDDPYIEDLFSGVSRIVIYDRAYTSSHKLLRSLWEDLGGEEFARKELEKECKKIKIEKIQEISKNYSLKAHIFKLQMSINEIERDLRGSMEIAYRKLPFYFSIE